MTDRLHSLTVVLANDTRDDDCDALIAAIEQFHNVINVSGNVADIEGFVARSRVKEIFKRNLLELFKELDK